MRERYENAKKAYEKAALDVKSLSQSLVDKKNEYTGEKNNLNTKVDHLMRVIEGKGDAAGADEQKEAANAALLANNLIQNIHFISDQIEALGALQRTAKNFTSQIQLGATREDNPQDNALLKAATQHYETATDALINSRQAVKMEFDKSDKQPVQDSSAEASMRTMEKAELDKKDIKNDMRMRGSLCAIALVVGAVCTAIPFTFPFGIALLAIGAIGAIATGITGGVKLADVKAQEKAASSAVADKEPSREGRKEPSNEERLGRLKGLNASLDYEMHKSPPGGISHGDMWTHPKEGQVSEPTPNKTPGSTPTPISKG